MNLPLATDSTEQVLPAIIPDGGGGTIIAWQDHYDGPPQIHAQRLNANGISQWGANGTFVSGDVHDFPIQFVSDGAGGAIFTWQDSTNGTTADIIAQRVDASGATRWSLGVGVCTASGLQTTPVIVGDGSGGAIIAWSDRRGANSDIYAQRLNAAGVPQWSQDGISVCQAGSNQTNPQITSDGAGGAIVAWNDQRNDAAEVWAERVNAAGIVQWQVNGVNVCPGFSDAQGPCIASDDAGGAIVVWQDYRNNGTLSIDIYAQRLDAAGALQWTTGGRPVSATTGNQLPQAVVADGAGGIIVAWGYQGDINAQRMDAGGVPQWNANGETIYSQGQAQGAPAVAADGAGGAIITWPDDRDANDNLYAQRVIDDGTPQWAIDGVPVTTAAQTQESPMVVVDGSGGAVVVWEDSRDDNTDVYAQRIGSDGATGPPALSGWDPDGTAIATGPGSQLAPTIVSDAEGGAILAWEDDGSLLADAMVDAPQPLGPGHARIMMIRITTTGTVESGWTAGGAPVTTGTGSQTKPHAVSDEESGAIIVWTDDRNIGLDIYAQRVLASSATADDWPEEGLAVCTAGQSQYDPQITTDGSHGAIVVWADLRGGPAHLFAQRLRANGTVAWTANGVSIAAAAESQAQVITSDGVGGAFIAWSDSRAGNSNIYVAHVDATGARVAGWPADGLAVYTAAGDQVDPVIVPDGAGGAIVTWADGRGAASDIYSQCVTPAGVAAWTANGIPVCGVAGVQQHPRSSIDGLGGAIVAWEDQRSGAQGVDLYAMRVTHAGTLDGVWTAGGAPLCTAANDQHDAVMIEDGTSGAIVSWVDERNGGADVFADEIRGDGTRDPRYAANGMPVSTAPGAQAMLAITTDGIGGAIAGWADGRVPAEDIYAMHLFGTVNASPTAVGDAGEIAGARLSAPYPNPFRRAAAMSFELPRDAAVAIDVLDVSGRRVAWLARGERFAAGVHTLRWSGSDERGVAVATGIYFVRFRSGSAYSTRRIALTR